MPKNFSNKPLIKASNLETMPPAIKFGYIANISKLNKIES